MDSFDTTPASPAGFRQAMRQLAGGVSVITAAHEGVRTGMTVTSVISVALDPPELLVSLSENSSSWSLIQSSRHFGVNVLASHQEAVARSFSGHNGLQGEQRYAGSQWHCTQDGVWLLDHALASFACQVVNFNYHSGHILVIGRVISLIAAPTEDAPLIYWQGDYRHLSEAVTR